MSATTPGPDIAIVGGTTASVAAALDLKARGFSCVVVSGRTYLGEDVCDALRLALPADLETSDPLLRRLYGESVSAGGAVRPAHLKRELDRVLEQADIPVLFGTVPTRLCVGPAGAPDALEVFGRSGHQLLSCRAIVDATSRGEVARLAGVPLTAPTPGFAVVRRVIGGEAENAEGWRAEGRVLLPAREGERAEVLWAHHSRGTIADGSWSAWMRLEQDTRLRAYRPGQLQSADGVEAFTGERIAPGVEPANAAGDFEKIGADAVSVLGGRLWVIGPAANVDTTTRERLSRHDGAVVWGRRVASLLCDSLPQGNAAHEVSPPRDLPVAVEEVDVLVVGGGTGGAPAAIAAAREGARTLVAESLSGLGGVGTLGLIGKYWFGNRVGFTAELDAAVAARTTREFGEGSWDVEAKMQWYHEAISAAGGRIWYKTAVARALKEGDRLTGAILATPQGLVEVRARCVVDATGSAEVAALAGAETVPIGGGHLAVQGAGLPPRNPGADYTNTDYDFIDDSAARDVDSAHRTAREKFRAAFDVGQLVDSRERRRIVGDYEVTPMDIRLARVFPDTIVKARSNFDTHGFTIHPLFLIVPPDHGERIAHIPLRALLPRGLDGVLVTGLGISAHRDAMPVIRMQPDVQNQGYAAGMIAAMARDGRVRALGLDNIQRRLVEKGILEPGLRGAPDSFPLAAAEIDRALAAAPDDPEQIDRVFTLEEPARDERLRAAFAGATSERARRFFAFVLGVLGDGTGAEVLAEEVAASAWDEGWNYRGMGQFGASLSPLDARIIALGRCGERRFRAVLDAKAAALPLDAAFSHYRALAEAYVELGDSGGAAALEELLRRPGVAGHHLDSAGARLETATSDPTETRFRNASLVELHLASALSRLAPDSQRGRAILENYARDVRGLFAKHARATLGERPSGPRSPR